VDGLRGNESDEMLHSVELGLIGSVSGHQMGAFTYFLFFIFGGHCFVFLLLLFRISCCFSSCTSVLICLWCLLLLFVFLFYVSWDFALVLSASGCTVASSKVLMNIFYAGTVTLTEAGVTGIVDKGMRIY